MPVYVASEFSKDNMKLQKELFEQTGTWLDFNQDNKSVVIATLDNSFVNIQVVSGSI